MQYQDHLQHCIPLRQILVISQPHRVPQPRQSVHFPALRPQPSTKTVKLSVPWAVIAVSFAISIHTRHLDGSFRTHRLIPRGPSGDGCFGVIEGRHDIPNVEQHTRTTDLANDRDDIEASGP